MKKMTQANFILNHVEERVAMEREFAQAKEAKKMERTKRERVVFIRRIVALTFLMVGLFSIVTYASGFEIFNAETLESKHMKSMDEEINEYEQVEVFVWEGETAWDIQAKLTPGKDTRDMLYLVSHLNGLDNIGDIKAGQTLVFLTAK